MSEMAGIKTAHEDGEKVGLMQREGGISFPSPPIALRRPQNILQELHTVALGTPCRNQYTREGPVDWVMSRTLVRFAGVGWLVGYLAVHDG